MHSILLSRWWITLLLLLSAHSAVIGAASTPHVLWNLTDDGRYVIEVKETEGKTHVFLRHRRGTWETTNPRLLEAFKSGLVVKINGKSYVPIIVDGPPPRTAADLAQASNIQITMFDKELVRTGSSTMGLAIGQERTLTIYDIRRFANDDSYPQTFSPVNRPNSSRRMLSDLHTHLAGHIPVNDLIGMAHRSNVAFPVALLDEIGIKYPRTQVKEEKIQFSDLLRSQEFKRSNGLAKLEDAMSIESSRVRTFMNMEDKYRFRGPITKNIATFRDQLWSAAQASEKTGVKYVEMSIANIIDPAWLSIAHSELPAIEKTTGVKMRFVVGLWRHSDPEWNFDEITRTRRMARVSPYIVGIDFMGHETNSSQDLADQIKTAVSLKEEFGPNFQIRVHAGENPLNPSNVRMASELGASRVGHGLYIEKDAEAIKLNPQSQKIDPKVLSELKKNGTIIEINPISNQALNNLSGGSQILLNQFRQFKAAGISVVFGTDGIGMYGAGHSEIERMLTALGFTEADFEYVRSSEASYLRQADIAFTTRARKIGQKNKIPTKPEIETYVDQQGRKYTSEIEKSRTLARQNKLKEMTEDFARKQIASYDKVAHEFSGMKAIDISGGSASQFASLQKEGRMAELRLQEVHEIFRTLLKQLDPKKVFFLDGGTQFGVEQILHEEVAAHNATNPKNKFKIVGVLPEEANPTDVVGPSQHGITHYKIGGKSWADFGVYKLELLQQHGGAKIAIAGKMFVADEFRAAINSNPDFQILYHDGPVGASTDLAKERPAGAYTNAEELIHKLAGDAPTEYLRPMTAHASRPLVLKDELIRAAEKGQPTKLQFVKDAPLLGYRIKSDRFEDIPEVIQRHMGAVDQTKYAPKYRQYLQENMGSIIALQINGDQADFYIIGKQTYLTQYTLVPIIQVATQNATYYQKLQALIPQIIAQPKTGLVGILKTKPVEMIRLSDLGYPVNQEISIESPWGTQTKPANADAFLVWDEGKKQYYMVNAAPDGNPIAYVPAKRISASSSARCLQDALGKLLQ